MKLPHDKFCVLPWVSIEASPIGTVRPCCLADDEILDDAGNKFELSTANFADIQNSNHMRSLREQFLAGQKNCFLNAWAKFLKDHLEVLFIDMLRFLRPSPSKLTLTP